MEAEAEVEAVDGRLKEAEAKEKLTAVPSLCERYMHYTVQLHCTLHNKNQISLS